MELSNVIECALYAMHHDALDAVWDRNSAFVLGMIDCILCMKIAL